MHLSFLQGILRRNHVHHGEFPAIQFLGVAALLLSPRVYVDVNLRSTLPQIPPKGRARGRIQVAFLLFGYAPFSTDETDPNRILFERKFASV